MALVKTVLSQLLKQGFQDLSKNKNATLDDVKKVWNDAYKAYALPALPVSALPTALFAPTGGPADSLSGAPGAFVADLASGLQTFWTSGQWAPDVKFKYQTADASGFVSPTMALQLKDLDQAVDGIADDLHTYTTTMVKVTATSIQTGVTATVLVS